MFIRYIPAEADNKIFISRQTADGFGLIPNRVILNIGAWRMEVRIEISDDLPAEVISLSEGLTKKFILPDILQYELRFEQRNLYIGPVIAFLVVSNSKTLTPETLDKFKKYYAHYNEINGLVYICATNGINTMDKTIEGYYLLDNGSWEKGIFPYPGAIYRRTDIPRSIHDDLIQSIGNRIFNAYFFNKWELWQYLSPYPQIRQYLPHTEKLVGISGLDNMLQKYNSIYLKRILGCKAKGIIKVEKSDDAYHFIYRLKEQVVLKEVKEVEDFLKNLNTKNDYIVQQSIPIKRYQNRSFDFRVILQKGSNKEWACSGIMARFGKENSIATNFLLSGFALSGQEALTKVFDMNEREAFIKEQEIVNVCIDACKMLDKCVGNYGDVGIDVIVDENLKVWILEINKLHDHKFPLYSINDSQMYYKVITTPFKYAKALALEPR